MKIVHGKEPLFCSANETFYNALLDLQNVTSRTEFVEKLESWLPLQFNSMTQLQDWILVLNLVDSYLQDILYEHRKSLILIDTSEESAKDNSGDGRMDTGDDATDLPSGEILVVKKEVLSMLRFTTQLLQNSVGKELYNSAEHVSEFLRSYDDDLMISALETLVALAMLPLSHRCDFELTRHFTALHKTTTYSEALFEIVDAGYSVANSHVANFLSDEYEPDDAFMTIKIDLGARSKYCKSLIASASSEEVEEIDNALLSSESFSIPDLRKENRSLVQILSADSVSDLSLGLRFSVMFAIRLRRLLTSLTGRQKLVKILYQATAILLGCFPDSGVLYSFFQDKIDLLKNFLFLLRTGPGSVEDNTDAFERIPLEIRLLACQCLEAIVGSRDNTSSPIFIRYPWMLYDLGVHRGQYMGLFPCLLRSATSYLVSVDNSDVSKDLLYVHRNRGNSLSLPVIFESPSATDQNSSYTVTNGSIEWNECRIQWIERVLMLLIALVNSTTALPALTDNGLIPSLLSILQRRISLTRPTNAVYVEILATEVLENAIVSHPAAMTAFKEQHGMETVVRKLLSEIHLITSDTLDSIPVVKSIIIQELFSILSSTIHEGRQDMTDSRIGQWYRSQELCDALILVYNNPYLFTGAVLSPALQLLADAINNDPAPPTLHTHMVGSGVAKAALSTLQRADSLKFTGDCLVSYLSVLSAVSLTADGLNLVKVTNPLQHLFELFHNEKYFYPASRILMHDLPGVIGTNMEELIRHYPFYLEPCMEQLIGAMEHIIIQGEAVLNRSEITMNNSYLMILQYACCVLACLEPLLLKKATTQLFLERGGITRLLDITRLGFGPPRYFLASLSCTVDSTVLNIAYEPLISLSYRCFSQIADLEAVALFDEIIKHMEKSVDKAKELIRSYLNTFIAAEGEATTSSACLKLFLDSVKREPLQDVCGDNGLTPQIRSYCEVMMGIMDVNTALNVFKFTLSSHSPASSEVKQCIDALGRENVRNLIKKLLEDLYLPAQTEMARARGSFVNSTMEDCVKVHPMYKLLVVAHEHVLVKDSLEDSAKRVCKLGRGVQIDAFERKSGGNHGLLKYRTKDGWISVYKSISSVEPQILVLDVRKKSQAEHDEELARNSDSFKTISQCVDFEKFANVSARRGGFLGLHHFTHSVKIHFLAVITRNLYTANSSFFSARDNLTINRAVVPYYSDLLSDCLSALLPQSVSDQVIDGPTGIDKIQSLLAAHSDDTKRTTSSGLEIPSNEAETEDSSGMRQDPTFKNSSANNVLFLKTAAPDLCSFGTSKVYLSIRVTELCHKLLFDQRRSRSELNALLFAKLLYGPEFFLENLMRMTTLTFLCSLPVSKSELRPPEDTNEVLYDGEWFYVEDSTLDSKDDVPESRSPMDLGGSSKPFPSYLAYRRALRERRLLALSSIDGIIDLWKSICATINVTTSAEKSAAERCLLLEGTNYDPLITKRAFLLLAARYFVQIWSHEELRILPPSTVKNITDFLGVFIKSINSLRTASLRTPAIPPSRSGSSASESLSRFPYPVPSFQTDSDPSNGSRRGRMGVRRPLMSSGGTRAQPPALFQPDDNTVHALQDMGFARRTIDRAMNVIRSNNVNQLVSFLLENPFIADDPEPTSGGSPDSRAAGVSSGMHAMSNGNTSSNTQAQSSTDTHSAAIDAAAVSSVEPQAVPVIGGELPADEHSNATGVVAASPSLSVSAPPPIFNTSSSAVDIEGKSTTAEQPHTKIEGLLPPISKFSDGELKIWREALKHVLDSLYDTVPNMCLDLIEAGDSKDHYLFDSDIQAANSTVTREVYTVMILNQMLKCLDKNSTPEGALRMVQLSWLYRRALRILDNHADLDSNTSTALYGILHAVVVLLTGKIVSGSNSRSGGHDLWFIILAKDDRFKMLYSRLIEKIERLTGEDAARDSPIDPNSYWIAPAMLILDIMAQPVLIDPASLRHFVKDLENFEFYTRQGRSSDDPLVYVESFTSQLLTEKLKNYLHRKYFDTRLGTLTNIRSRSNSITNHGIARKVDSVVQDPPLVHELQEKDKKSPGKSGESKDSDEQPLKVPLFDEGLSLDIKCRCVSAIVNVLRYFSSKDTSSEEDKKLNSFNKYASILQAALQLLAHLTRDLALARYFHSQDGMSIISRCRGLFDGFGGCIFTIFQQVLEDEKHVKYAMGTAIRMCLTRLSRNKTLRVHFKVFVEVICPLLYRDQRLFLNVLKSCTSVTSEDGHTYIAYRHPVKEDKATSTNSQSVPSNSEKSSRKENDQIDKSNLNTDEDVAKRQRTSLDSDTATKYHDSLGGRKEEDGSDNDVRPGVLSAFNSLPVPSAYEYLDTLFSDIVFKWVAVKSWPQGESEIDWKRKTQSKSFLTISELLMIAADLAVAVPQVAVCAHRYNINPSNFTDTWETTSQFLPVKHAITGQLQSSSFIAFLIHGLLLPSKVQPKWLDSNNSGTEAAAGSIIEKTKSAIGETVGSNIRDACCYFIASLCSRPGEGRKRVLQQLLRSMDYTGTDLDNTESIRCAITFAKTIVCLINPPSFWSHRDVFILPSKDILLLLTKMKTHIVMGSVMCMIRNDHPLALEAMIMLSIPTDALIRKGMPALDGVESKNKSSTEQKDSLRKLVESGPGTQNMSIDNTGPGAAIVRDNQLQNSTIAVSMASSLHPRGEDVSPQGASNSHFISPSPSRPRFNTDNSQMSGNCDNDERLLFSGVSHGADGGDEHGNQHLMRPSHVFEPSSDEDNIDDDDDVDVDPDNDGHLHDHDLDVDHMNHGEEDDDEDDDEEEEDDDEEEEEEEGEEIEEDEEDEQESDAFDEGDGVEEEEELHGIPAYRRIVESEEEEDNDSDDEDIEDDEIEDDEDHDGDGDGEESNEEHEEHEEQYSNGNEVILLGGDEFGNIFINERPIGRLDNGENVNGRNIRNAVDGPGIESITNARMDADRNAEITTDDVGSNIHPTNSAAIAANEVIRVNPAEHNEHESSTGLIDGQEGDEGDNVIEDWQDVLDEDADGDGDANSPSGNADDDDEGGSLLQDDMWLGSMPSGPERRNRTNSRTMVSTFVDRAPISRAEGAATMRDYINRMRMRTSRGSLQPQHAVSAGIALLQGEMLSDSLDESGSMRSALPFESGRNGAGPEIRLRMHGNDMTEMFDIFDMAGSNDVHNVVISSGMLGSGSRNSGNAGSDDDIFHFGSAYPMSDIMSGGTSLTMMRPPPGRLDRWTFSYGRPGGTVTVGGNGISATNLSGSWHSTNSGSSHPRLHPLLGVTDARRNRFLLPSTLNPSSRSGFSMLNSGGTLSIMSQIRESLNSSYVLDSTNRHSRTSVSPQRRSLGPIVSDRRWGTDIGDLEPIGSRLHSLSSVLEFSIRGRSESTESTASHSLNRNGFEKFRHLGDNDSDGIYRLLERHHTLGGHDPFDSEPFDRLLRDETTEQSNRRNSRSETEEAATSRNEVAVDDLNTTVSRENRRRSGNQEESKEEGVLQETKVDDFMMQSADQLVNRNMYGEESKEEGPLQESKEEIPSSAEQSVPSNLEETIRSPVPQSEAQPKYGSQIFTAPHAEEKSADIVIMEEASNIADNNTCQDSTTMNSGTNMAGSSEGLGSSSAEVCTEMITDPARIDQNDDLIQSHQVDGENLSFINSLPPDLREEVLLGATSDFLQSLPRSVQAEAQRYNEQRAIAYYGEDLQHDSSRANGVAVSADAEVAAVLAPTATAAASAASSSGVSSNAAINAVEATSNSHLHDATSPLPATSSTQPPSSSTVALDISTIMEDIHQISSNDNSAEVPSFNVGGSLAAPASNASSNNRQTDDVTSKGQDAEDLERNEQNLNIFLADDRKDPHPPYNAHMVARLLRSLFNANKSKLPRAVLKLSATLCRYRAGRQWIVRALFASFHHDGDRAIMHIRQIPCCESSTDASSHLVDRELQGLKEAVEETMKNPVHLRRIICGMSFLLRKTDKLIWYDIVSRPVPGSGIPWLFGELLQLLGIDRYASSVNLEFILQLLEDICSTFSRLSVAEANELGREGSSEVAMRTARRLSASPDGSNDASTPFGGGELKRARRTDVIATSSASSTFQTSGSALASNEMGINRPPNAAAADQSRQSAEHKISKDRDPGKSSDKIASERVRIPFPVLTNDEAFPLSAIAGSEECGGASRKRLMRIMRNLSLHDGNWYMFLNQLADVAGKLASRATAEFSKVLHALNDVARQGETAAEAMGHMELSAPGQFSEVKLLNVLRLMTVLRARSSESARVEADSVAEFIRRVDASELWVTLCDCLDIVRSIEGIVDNFVDESESYGTPQSGFLLSRSRSSDGMLRPKASSKDSKKEKDKEMKYTLSALTMRFMPLIECFMTVCASTLLHHPDGNEKTVHSESVKRSGQKRSISDAGGNDPTTTSFATPGPNAADKPSSSVGVTPAVLGINRMLPGSRFRQHAAYFQMQLELRNSDPTSRRLILFVQQNRILFNNVLRNNVHLLEASFSPLINVPRCRQLLHFDVKRAYFKMKLKRMRQSAARMHGALRVSVRRQRVFEESFQALRYKTADEMRRRLSITFHGEEGADAGGLTREWYSVLAREIFNADYVLFISTGDNVTFQPNPQSFVNPDHLSYFKFVGRVIGKAICDGQLLDAHFTRSFYKHILGLPVSVVDLEAIEPEYYKSLRQILETPLDLLGLDLTFSAETNDFGKVETVDLIPNGQNVAVTDQTKHEYVKLIAHHRMTASIRKQTDAFLEGFHELVPPELISIFDAQELELLISGLPDIDLDDLRAHTDYHGYKPTDPEIGYFWSVLKSFSKQDKALFLQFVTGTSKVPLDGFAALQGADGVKRFNIHKAFGGTNLLPCAHTCFNQLDLPEYPSEEVMREKLMIATREGSEGFGFA